MTRRIMNLMREWMQYLKETERVSPLTYASYSKYKKKGLSFRQIVNIPDRKQKGVKKGFYKKPKNKEVYKILTSFEQVLNLKETSESLGISEYIIKRVFNSLGLSYYKNKSLSKDAQQKRILKIKKLKNDYKKSLEKIQKRV